MALIERYKNFLRYEKGVSALTYTAYLDDLGLLAGFMGDDPVEKCGHTDARAFIMSLIEKGESSVTINRRLSSLRTFFNFLLKEEVITKNPMQKIRSLRTPSRLPNYLAHEQIQTLISSMEIALEAACTNDWEIAEAYPAARDAAIILMLYYTGLRRSEVASLRLSDLDIATLTIRVTGKGNKERLVPINRGLQGVLEKYIKKRAEFCCKIPSEFLFLGKNMDGLRGDSIYKIVRKVLGSNTTGARPSPHTLRHTFATQLLGSDVSIRTIQELLGHSSITSTQIYAHTTIEGLKKNYEKAHPRGANYTKQKTGKTIKP